jgi:hypothetical protein
VNVAADCIRHAKPRHELQKPPGLVIKTVALTHAYFTGASLPSIK